MENIKDIISKEDIHNAIRLAMNIGYVAVGVVVWNATRNPIVRILGSIMVCDAIRNTTFVRHKVDSSNYQKREETPKKYGDFKMGFQ